MNTIILNLNKDKSYEILCTDSFIGGTDSLYLMARVFCSSSFYKDALKGIDNFNLGGLDEVSFEDGYEYEDFYIAFIDTCLYDRYTKDFHGVQAVDLSAIPKLKFSKENFNHVLKMIVHLHDTKPEYVVITQSDNGWVDLWGKDELSNQEQLMVQEFQESK